MSAWFQIAPGYFQRHVSNYGTTEVWQLPTGKWRRGVQTKPGEPWALSLFDTREEAMFEADVMAELET